MRRPLFLLIALIPAAAGAQGFADASLRLAPQFTGYAYTQQDGQKVTVNEFAMPFAFVMPLTSRLTFDVSTAFANASFKAGSTTSTLSGLTDTQVRLNYTLGTDMLVVTLGANLPTGQYKVPDNKVAAAGAMGNDFFAFPVSSFGNGFAGTGGVALALPVGAWNLGLGASFRKSAEFGAFGSGDAAVRFTPANEVRVRAGVDGAIGSGRLMLGLVYSDFGKDATINGTAPATTTSTGSRTIGQAAIDMPVGSSQLYIGGWLLHRAAGEIAVTTGTVVPSVAQNIGNVTAALGFNAGSLFLEPSVETRFWSVESGDGGGFVAYAGLRTRFSAGALELSPSVAIGGGSVKESSGTDNLVSYKVGLTIRLGQ
jgi:hypothetical protein